MSRITSDFPEEFKSRLVKAGCSIRSYKVPKRAKEVLSRMRSTADVIIDKRVVSLIDDSEEFLKRPASIYTPDKMLDSICTYYERVKGAKFTSNKFTQQALADTFHAFKPHRKLTPIPNDFKKISETLQPDSSSGFPKYAPRAEDLDYYYTRYLSVVSGNKQFGPCTVERRTQRTDSESESKVRLVHAYPTDATIAEGKFARPLIDYYLENQTHPIAFGMTKLQLGSALQNIQNRKNRYSLDYSKFDGSIHQDLIYKMFGMIKKWFHLTDEDNSVLNKVIKYFIQTPLLSDWGLIIPQRGGIPSGSYFTQIIGSMVNYFLISYLFRMNNLIPFKELIKVLGDDCIVGTNYKLKNFAHMEEHFGVTIHEDKTEVTKIGEPVHFLGRYYNLGLAHGDSIESKTKAVYPERYRKVDTYNQVRLLVASYLMEHCENASWIFKSLRVNPGHPITFRHFFREYEETYNDDMQTILYHGSRQMLLASKEGRDLPTFIPVSLLA